MSIVSDPHLALVETGLRKSRHWVGLYRSTWATKRKRSPSPTELGALDPVRCRSETFTSSNLKVGPTVDSGPLFPGATVMSYRVAAPPELALLTIEPSNS